MTRARTVALASLLLLFSAGTGSSCGGPETAVVDRELWPIEDLLQELIVPFDGLDAQLRGEFLFLYPFGFTKGAALDELFREAYGLRWSDAGLTPDRRRYCFDYSNGLRSCGGRAYGFDWHELSSDVLTVTLCESDGTGCREVTPGPRRLQPFVGAFDTAVGAHDWAGARRATRQIVDAIIDMPAARAGKYSVELNRALEFVELEPAIPDAGDELAATFFAPSGRFEAPNAPKPFRDAAAVRDRGRVAAEALLAADPHQARAATLRFVALQEMMKRDIPDGWAYDIQERSLGETWKRLEGAVDAWLSDYPAHPLADLVHLLEVRVFYFSGDEKRAFETLLAMYPRHLERVLAELRYLLQHAGRVSLASLVDVEQADAAIVTSLLLPGGVPTIADDVWTKLWKRAADHARDPWARNLEERLLLHAAQRAQPGAPLPAEFPGTPENPSQLWGALRLVALIKAEQWAAAREEASSLKPTPFVASLAARIDLSTGTVPEAAMIDGLADPERRYLVRVLLSDDQLQELARRAGPPVKEEAARSLGVRRAAAGDWDGAVAAVRSVDPDRAALWEQCAALAADETPAGLLRWARFLAAHRGRIWYPRDRAWDRGVRWRLVRVEPPPEAHERVVSLLSAWSAGDESRAIRRALLEDETWLTFRTLVAYLAAAPRTAQAETALRQANAAYNELINYNPLAPFWTKQLETDETVARLRQIGRRMRKTSAPGPARLPAP